RLRCGRASGPRHTGRERVAIVGAGLAGLHTMATRSVPLWWRMELAQLVNGRAAMAVAPIAVRNISRRVDCHVAETCSTHSRVGHLWRSAIQARRAQRFNAPKSCVRAIWIAQEPSFFMILAWYF